MNMMISILGIVILLTSGLAMVPKEVDAFIDRKEIFTEGSEKMINEMMKVGSIPERKARIIVRFLKNGGIEDAKNFTLSCKPEHDGYVLKFQSLGQLYSVELGNGLLPQRLLDKNNETIFVYKY